ncbi:hypothetical protein [Candidatus Electronema sp. JM]|uniref:hypothetical protein n=1 Tax=Candidatus Electronema sp. JM TaxID=3401571 RepID=UPI003AA7CF78
MDASSVSFRPGLLGLLFFSLGAPLLLSGCLPSSPPPTQRPAVPQTPVPPQSRQTISPEEQAAYSKQVLEPALATINGRIAAYEQRLRDWQDLGGSQETLKLTPDEVAQLITCRNKTAELQNAYKGLQERLRQEQLPRISREQIFGSLQDFKEQDIAYLEGECPKLFNSLKAPASQRQEPASAVAAPAQQETAPPEQAVQPMQSEQQAPAVDKGALHRQGLELLKSGHEQEARSAFASVQTAAKRDGDRRQEAEALQMLADLDFGHQDYAAARRKYTELRRIDSSCAARCGRYLAALEAVGTRRDELDTYAALLLGCLTYRPDKDGFTLAQQAAEFMRLFPESPLKSDAEDWSRKIEQEAEQWFSGLLAQAGKLPPEQAVKRLDQVPLDILPLDKQDIVRQKKEALQPAGAASHTEAPADGTPAAVPEGSKAQPAGPVSAPTASPLPDPAAALQETWDKGMAAMQAEDYDQAIELFTKLNGTEFGAKADGKVGEAQRLAGESIRKKAAALFQQALNAPDQATKKELLRSSKSLLEDILRKYPRAGIEAKVKRNLSSVDRELAAGSGGTQH